MNAIEYAILVFVLSTIFMGKVLSFEDMGLDGVIPTMAFSFLLSLVTLLIMWR